jgi:phage terminase Nu1 subunit (DNA packaging protein)
VSERLFTGRELVGELQRLGIGTWTPDAVRQWIREEPALPIAQPGQQGQSHRYRITDAIAWLRARGERERAKGWTAPEPAASDAFPVTPLDQGGKNGGGTPAAPNQSNERSAFSDPRNEKAYHEARLAKLKADELEGKLLPAEDVERAQLQLIISIRANVLSLPSSLALELEGATDFNARRRVIQAAVEKLLAHMATDPADDQAPALEVAA